NGEVEQAVTGDLALGGPPMRADAIFRIQSMTKAVTTAATLRLVERGALGLDDAVERWLPELADRRVLRQPASPLDDTVRAERAITVRDLLCNTSGYGAGDDALGAAMHEADVDPGPQPSGLDAAEWLARLAALPLGHQPGRGFRYHTSFAVLGILLARLVSRPLGEHLRDDVFAPLGMVDTGFWVPEAELGRLPASYRPGPDGGLEECEALGGGSNAGRPVIDVSHEELVSTAADWLAFARMLRDRGRHAGETYLTEASVAAMTTDQMPPEAKTPDSFGADYWAANSWGFGVGIETGGPHPGRFGWSGGLGTDFTVDPASGTITVLLTQRELSPEIFGLLFGFRDLVDR
ncbi:MAG: serine hydrolase domain-containing protein, partial [Propionibacteriaceae bacterium]|nr:serine hydrolase domain-containing protein [Propionibacteriaceae bacterium]